MIVFPALTGVENAVVAPDLFVAPACTNAMAAKVSADVAEIRAKKISAGL